MFKNVAVIFACLVALACRQVSGQDLGDLLPAPTSLWSNQIFPLGGDDLTIQPGLLKGNGAFLTPDESSVITTSVGGTVTSFSAASGEPEWEYNPPANDDLLLRCHSNMVFTTSNALEPYMVYSLVDGENTPEPLTRVVALDMTGAVLWTSESLPGAAAGSPVISDDGRYVFLTHNANGKTTGYFTALFAAGGGAVFYTESYETQPFSPPGIYHSPIEGFYDGENGVGNTNDIIMWANAVEPDADSIGKGFTFVFQFPVGFADTDEGVGYMVLGDIERDFLGETAPVITNFGRSAYWSVSRSGFVCWVGVEPLLRFGFSRAAFAAAGFDRNSGFAGTPVFASPALSSDPMQPAVFGGSASTQFVRLNFDFSESITAPTSSLIMAEAKVDPGDRAVYFVESSGILHQVDFDDISDIWTFDVGFSVEGEISMKADGSVVYVGDTRGMITALQVTEIPPTPEPSETPSGSPSATPTMAPTVPTDTPSAAPTDEPSESPSAVPSESPSFSPTGTETESPAATPTPAPVAPGTPTTETEDTDSPSETPDGVSSAATVSFVALVATIFVFVLV